MEILDLYDKNRNPLNRTMARKEFFSKREENEHCFIVSIWVVNKNGEILTTLRASNKSSYPNKWESTGGAVLAGETPLQGAIRELYEETGIKASEKDFVKIREIHDLAYLIDVYVVSIDVDTKDIKIQESEVADAKFVSIPKFEQMIEEDVVAKPVIERFTSIYTDLLKIANNCN